MEANEAPQQYISKSALVAEIERLIKKNELYLDDNVSDSVRSQKIGAYSVLCDLRHFIDTLEVKGVDLDNEIEKCLKQHNMLALGKKDFTEIAKHFFELGMQVSNKQIEEKEHINSPEEESNTVYKNITMINMDGNIVKSKIEQREKV